MQNIQSQIVQAKYFHFFNGSKTIKKSEKILPGRVDTRQDSRHTTPPGRVDTRHKMVGTQLMMEGILTFLNGVTSSIVPPNLFRFDNGRYV